MVIDRARAGAGRRRCSTGSGGRRVACRWTSGACDSRRRTVMLQAQSALGLVVLLFLAWALSEERRLSAWRIAVTGAVLQLVLAASMLYLPALTDAVAAANRLVAMLDAATEAGTSLVFGYLGGGPLPFEEGFPGRELRPRLSGPARHPGGQRAGGAPHPLAHPAARHPGLRPAPGAQLPRRRAGGAGERGQRARRDDRGAAPGAPLPVPPVPLGALRTDGHRHGDDRRHGLRALFTDPDARCCRTPPPSSWSRR